VSRSLTPFQALVLGGVVLAALVLAGVGVFVVGSRHWPWNERFTLKVGFPQARGVEPGTRVRVQGIDAGEVALVRPPDKPGDPVMLTLVLAGSWGKGQLIRADASARIVSEGVVGSKVIDLDPGTETAPAAADQAEIAGRPSMDFADALEVLGAEKGKLGEVLDSADGALHQINRTMASIQRSTDALPHVPVVGGYFKGPGDVLYRPKSECTPTWFAEQDLFDRGKAQLTGAGKQRLDALVGRLSGLTNQSGAELVVAAYVDPRRMADGERAKKLTQTQSEAVLDYLTDHGAVHRKYWVLPGKRQALGLGNDTAALPEQEKLPSSGVGILVYVPHKG
jgi:phospholipid/cholesterol/gamma-HCH transport system substrate-binding protein